jgi:hypothetical protein
MLEAKNSLRKDTLSAPKIGPRLGSHNIRSYADFERGHANTARVSEPGTSQYILTPIAVAVGAVVPV